MNSNFIYVIFIIFIFSCSKNELGDAFQTKKTNENQRVDKLHKLILKNQYYNVNILDSLANEFLKIKSNRKANIFGKYYILKASYFRSESDLKIKEFEKIYEEIRDEKEFEFLRLDIDLLLLEYYYRDIDYENTSRVLENSINYIFDSKYSLERDALIYGLSTKIDHPNKKERLNQILNSIEKIKSKPWSIYHSKIHSGLIGTYYLSGNKKKAIEHLEFLIKKNKENNIISEVIPLMNSLAYVLNNENSFILANDAILIAENSGHTKYLYKLRRNLGHFYFNTKRYKEAYREYLNAIAHETALENYKSNAIDYVYLGSALFHMNKIKNLKKADSLYDLALKLSRKKDLTTKKSALQSKLWAYQKAGYNKKTLALKKKITEINYSISNNKIKKKDFHLNTILKINSKDNEIKLLTIKNSIDKVKIERQNFFLLLSILILLTLMALIYSFKRKISFLKKLDDKNIIIKRQNEELVDLVSKLKSSNTSLKNKNNEIESLLNFNERTLFSKILKISTYNDAISKLTKKISNIVESENKIKPSDLFNIEKSLNSMIDEDEIWSDFQIQFEKTRPNFFKKLKQVSPDLSVNDLKHCSYIIAKLRSKDVANLINVSPRSVETTRYRIKKKLGLDKSSSLFDFLHSLS